MLSKLRGIPDEEREALLPSILWRFFKFERLNFWMIFEYLILKHAWTNPIYADIDALVLRGRAVHCKTTELFKKKYSNCTFYPVMFLAALFIVFYIFINYLTDYCCENIYKYYIFICLFFLIIKSSIPRREFNVFLNVFLVTFFRLALVISRTWTKKCLTVTYCPHSWVHVSMIVEQRNLFKQVIEKELARVEKA